MEIDFSSAKVLIVGDVMLDSYWYGVTSRISPEAPVPIVHINESEERPGGSGNVAFNISSLGGHVDLLGIVGTDKTAESLQAYLVKAGIHCYFHKMTSLKTVNKLRVFSQNQQLIRLDFEQNFAHIDICPLIQTYHQQLPDVDVVILSDYGKGTLYQVEQFILSAKKAGKPVLIDPKGRDFSKYRGATLMTPNLSEFEAVVGYCQNDSDIAEKAEQLRAKLDLQALLITRGKNGMSLIRQGCRPFHLPTEAKEVYDVTGAGDTVIATLAVCLAVRKPMEEATRIANLAAGIVVGKLGSATTDVTELHQALHDRATTVIVTEDKLKRLIELAQAKGEKIVMTNGCFDILHAGHVSYLDQARQLGDKLVVAINSDESVRQLKGTGRPFNNLEQRMTVIAALESVDWVIALSEETPERLYCQLLPDLIVKGRDDQPENIAGAECIRKNGGQLAIIDYVEGQSTTEIISKIKSRVL